MTKCFSLTASRNWCLRSTFSGSGLRSTITDLGDGTIIHCWVPKVRKETKPDLLLLHGFGANAMWQWGPEIIPRLIHHFNLYVPDLVFFGDSYTTRRDRSDEFQARCVYRVMEANSVKRIRVVGLSYGGFVAYSLAVQFKDAVERVVICCAGVCLEEKDLTEGLFPVRELEDAADILLPQTPEKMRELMRFTFVKPPVKTPNCLLVDFIDQQKAMCTVLSLTAMCAVPPGEHYPGLGLPSLFMPGENYSGLAVQEMCREHVQEKKELLRAIAKDRKLSDLPKITQPTLIIWGDKDQIFPVELGYRLKRHLGENAEMVVIKDTGHAFIVEKPKEFYKHLKSFLFPEVPPLPSSTTTTTTITTTTSTTTTITINTAAAATTANHHECHNPVLTN